MMAVRVGVSIMAVALLGAVAGCGADDGFSQEDVDRAHAEGVREGRQQAENEAKLKDLRQEIDELKKGESKGGDSTAGGDTTVVPPSGGIPGDAENCGSQVYARAGTTSCAFALNVASDYYSSESNSFESFSPTTGESYAMTCSGSALVVCTGGNNAAVYLP
jgi:hypothetical protein